MRCAPVAAQKTPLLQSLEGDWQEHHLFALRQALEAYRFYQGQIAACDQQIDALLGQLNAGREPKRPPAGRKIKLVRHNAPLIGNLHGELLTLCGGRDATLIPGDQSIGLDEIDRRSGHRPERFQKRAPFCRLGRLGPPAAPGGKRRRRLPRAKPMVGQIFREAVISIAKSKHLALGGFYRRIKGRRGAAIAAVATARKLAILFYRAMVHGLEYVERGLKKYQADFRAQSELAPAQNRGAFGLHFAAKKCMKFHTCSLAAERNISGLFLLVDRLPNLIRVPLRSE